MNKLIDHWEIFAGAIGSVFAYIRGRRVKRLDEISKLQEVYNTFTSDMNKKYEEMKQEIRRLNEKIERLEKENFELKSTK
jgi:predicted RNase H-like nuclease (RuvC/YqgF family)